MPRGGARQGAGRKPFPKDLKKKSNTFWTNDEECAYLHKQLNAYRAKKDKKK